MDLNTYLSSRTVTSRIRLHALFLVPDTELQFYFLTKKYFKFYQRVSSTFQLTFIQYQFVPGYF